jgi:peroxiredoxin/predicted 2-oxoglutarate/Fe(II)-dependent dioxygenase YbiX
MNLPDVLISYRHASKRRWSSSCDGALDPRGTGCVRSLVSNRNSLVRAGEPGPWFMCRSTSSDRYHIDTVAGRYIVLCFFGTASDRLGSEVLALFHKHREAFDDDNACFFGISVDASDERQSRCQASLPGYRYLWDFDGRVSRLYGAIKDLGNPQQASVNFDRHTVILDERLRVLSTIPIVDPQTHVSEVISLLQAQPRFPVTFRADIPAPVLIVPRIFEPALCHELMEYYRTEGSQESGFMREIDGRTVAAFDYGHKRRRDCEIGQEELRIRCMHRIHDRLLPEIARAFQFRATRIERYIVACYDSQTGGHFAPHRDNTTKGTAHRKFAVSINLNSDQFEGGELRFPEFGRQTYKPPTGGAVVFSCSLLHEATPVTSGLRYAFLPFLYDEDGAKLREQNLQYLDKKQS